MASKRSREYQDFFNKLKITAKDLDSSRAIQTLKDRDFIDSDTYHWMTTYITVSNERRERYKDYENMVLVPELDLGLVTYADDGSQLNNNEQVLDISSSNDDIIKNLNHTFFDNLDMNADLWRIFYGTCQYGDNFYEIIVDDKKKEIVSLKYLPPMNVERMEVDGNLLNFAVAKNVAKEGSQRTIYAHPEKSNKIKLQPWEVVHFRIDDNIFAPYGRSVLESGRRTWKQLSLMEDAMLVYRLERAPEKRVFYIDVGTLSTPEAEKFIERIKAKFRKKKYIDPACLALDTEIPLLDGRILPLQDIINEFDNGKDLWTYSVDRDNNNKIVPGHVKWAGITRKSTPVVKVTIDDGQSFTVTPDHKFLMRDGTYVPAEQLNKGDSLMPLYRKESDDKYKIKGYDLVVDPSINQYVFTHTISDFMFQEDFNNMKEEGAISVRHHRDLNKKNNNPTNIQVMSGNEHFQLHADMMSERAIAMWADPEYKRVINHKVVKVEKLNYTLDTGTLSIANYHNFAIGSYEGTFVKNSGKINEKATPLSILEDFWIPVRSGATAGQGTRIDVLQGGRQLNEIDDTKYFRDKLLKTMHIPPQYMQEGGGMDTRNALSQMDIKFSRSVERIQRHIMKGLEKIAIVSLTLQGFRGQDVRNFQIELTPPSNIAELLELEVVTQKINLVSTILSIENFLPKKWIYKNIMKFSDKQITDLETDMQLELASPLQQQTAGGGAQGFGAALPAGGGAGAGELGAVPGTAGGIGEVPAGPEAGAEAGPEAAPAAPAAPEAPEAPAGPEVAGKTITIGDKEFLLENKYDILKMIKYVKQKSNKDKDNLKYDVSEGISNTMRSNTYQNQFLHGEFRGINNKKK